MKALIDKIAIEGSPFVFAGIDRGKVIDKDEVFGRPRRLLELKLKGEKIRVMDVYNGSLEPDGTRRRFMLGAVAGVNTVHEAVAASYGLNPGAYREAVRT